MLLASSTGAVNAYHRPDLPTSLKKNNEINKELNRGVLRVNNLCH